METCLTVFQEVIPRFYDALVNDPALKAKYKFSPLVFNSCWYTVVICSKIRNVDFEFHPYRVTRQGRALLIAKLMINGKKVAVGNTHLESLDSAPIRKDQIAWATEYLKDYDLGFILGDFNMSEKETIPLGWVDTYKALYGFDPLKSTTFPSHRGTLIFHLW